MLTHTATIRGRAITWDHREVVQHGLNADRVELVTDREWQECDRVVAVLAKAGKESVRVDAGDGFFIPSALMEDAGPLRMCLLGYKGDSVRIVTAKEDAPLCVVESGEMGGTDPAPEQPDLWATLMKEVRKATEGAKTAAQSATRAEADLRAAAERGDFDGEDGKTPVRGVDYWTEADRKPIEDATLAATTAAGRADAAAKTATEGEKAREAEEAGRKEAETARVKAEQARVAAEAARVEAEKVRVIADVERGERVGVSVQKADAATAKATEAAGKATASATEADAAAKRADEAAKGASENVLVGTETAAVVHVEDAWPTLLRECKVLGKSEQVVTTGKNLFDESQLLSAAYSNGKIFIDRDYSVPQTLPFSIQRNTQGVVFKLACKTGMQLCLSYKRKQPKALTIITEYASEEDAHSIEKSIGNANFEREDVSYTCKGNGCVLAFVGAKWSGESAANNTFTIEPGCIQLEKGATATAYEPYTGGKPSPRPDFPQPITSVSKAEVMVAGKNFISAQDLESIASMSDRSVSVDENGFLIKKNDSRAWASLNPSIYLPIGSYTITYVGDNVFFDLKDGDSQVNRLSPGETFTVEDGSIRVKVIYEGAAENFGKIKLTDLQIEAGTVGTPFAAGTMTSTSIDLQGHELYGFDNVIRDELIIDANGDVTLIKRIFKLQLTHISHVSDADSFQYVQYTPSVRPPDGTKTMMSDRFTVGRGPHCIYTAGGAGRASIYVTFPLGTFASAEEYNAWIDAHPTEILYDAEEPQTIPLGKVSVPALPESTSNVWNADSITTDVSATYVRDVTLAFDALESKLTQAVVAAAANL